MFGLKNKIFSKNSSPQNKHVYSLTIENHSPEEREVNLLNSREQDEITFTPHAHLKSHEGFVDYISHKPMFLEQMAIKTCTHKDILFSDIEFGERTPFQAFSIKYPLFGFYNPEGMIEPKLDMITCGFMLDFKTEIKVKLPAKSKMVVYLYLNDQPPKKDAPSLFDFTYLPFTIDNESSEKRYISLFYPYLTDRMQNYTEGVKVRVYDNNQFEYFECYSHIELQDAYEIIGVSVFSTDSIKGNPLKYFECEDINAVAEKAIAQEAREKQGGEKLSEQGLMEYYNIENIYPIEERLDSGWVGVQSYDLSNKKISRMDLDVSPNSKTCVLFKVKPKQNEQRRNFEKDK